MIKHLQKLLIIFALSTFVLRSDLLASTQASSSAHYTHSIARVAKKESDQGGLWEKRKLAILAAHVVEDARVKADTFYARSVARTAKQKMLKKRKLVIPAANIVEVTVAKELSPTQLFFRSTPALANTLACFDYIDLCRLAPVSKHVAAMTKGVCMPEGISWVNWVNQLPRDKVLTEIKAALMRSPNPIRALEDIVNIYFQTTPESERLWDRKEIDNKNALITIPDKEALKTELKGILNTKALLQDPVGNSNEAVFNFTPAQLEQLENRRQEIFAYLKPCIQHWRPYAIAHSFLAILTNNFNDFCMCGPIPEDEEQWVASQAGPPIVMEYVRYVQAAQEIRPEIHTCLEKQGGDKAPYSKVIFDAFWQMHDLLAPLAAQFNVLPVTHESLAAADLMIKIYRQHLCSISQNILSEPAWGWTSSDETFELRNQQLRTDYLDFLTLWYKKLFSVTEQGINSIEQQCMLYAHLGKIGEEVMMICDAVDAKQWPEKLSTLYFYAAHNNPNLDQAFAYTGKALTFAHQVFVAKQSKPPAIGDNAKMQ